MKKSCPRNTRSTPMKQNLHDKAFVSFVCFVGKPLLANLCASWWEIAAPQKSSQHATNLAYSSTRFFRDCARKKRFCFANSCFAGRSLSVQARSSAQEHSSFGYSLPTPPTRNAGHAANHQNRRLISTPYDKHVGLNFWIALQISGGNAAFALPTG